MEGKIDRTEADSSFDALLKRACRGDDTAKKELLASCQSNVTRWVRRRMGTVWLGVESASDITQEVMLRVHDKFPTFSGSNKATWNGWLRSIMNNTIVDAARDAKAKQEARPLPLDAISEQAASQSRPSQRIGRRQEVMRVLQAISRLPPAQGRAVWLRHREGYSVEEIARLLGRNKEAVSTLIWRGLSELAEMRGEGSLRKQVSPSHLDRALCEYIELCDRGNAPELEAFLTAHPECASEMRVIIRWMQELTDLTAPDSTHPS